MNPVLTSQPILPPDILFLSVGDFWASMLLAFLVGVSLCAIGVWLIVNRSKLSAPQVSGSGKRALSLALAVLLVGAFALAQAHPTLAQTPVPLEIPTDVIFTETNNWLATFAPIAAIGIGIAIALAVLGYLGKMIVGAFKG